MNLAGNQVVLIKIEDLLSQKTHAKIKSTPADLPITSSTTADLVVIQK